MQVSVDHGDLILVLPDSLANKIAAGEVVQRPASVVKELVENAIDAGASNIAVHVRGAGSERIQVIDDGAGMSERDATSCFLRHATSKVKEVSDLDAIRTLGFRGEALASIAAVSRVVLRTCRAGDEFGTEHTLNGGESVSVAPCPAVPGTSISVSNLFYNVPARRKFLKRPATELKHILDSVQLAALANPGIGFSLSSGGSELFDVSAGERGRDFDTLCRRLTDLFSFGEEPNIIRLHESTSYLSVRGVLARPADHRRSRSRQFLFVNGRPVKNRSLEHSVNSAYEYLLPDGVYPYFALFLEIDPRHVDVNVHPAKTEVKFDDEQGVYGMLRTIVRKALGTAELTPDFLSAVPLSGMKLDIESTGEVHDDPDGAYRTDFSNRGIRPARQAEASPGEASARLLDTSSYERLASVTDATDRRADRDDASADLLWQLHDAFVLTQIRSGLVIIDQQAAHERILYENARRHLSEGFGLTQQLLFPKTIEFSPSDFALLQGMMNDLKSLGFDVDAFGGRSIVLRGVPAEIRPGHEERILTDVLDQFKSFETVHDLEHREKLARSMARQSAVRPGTRLSAKEMRSLIDRLFACDEPYRSPGGRPTIVKLSVEELRDRFARRK